MSQTGQYLFGLLCPWLRMWPKCEPPYALAPFVRLPLRRHRSQLLRAKELRVHRRLHPPSCRRNCQSCRNPIFMCVSPIMIPQRGYFLNVRLFSGDIAGRRLSSRRDSFFRQTVLSGQVNHGTLYVIFGRQITGARINYCCYIFTI